MKSNTPKGRRPFSHFVIKGAGKTCSLVVNIGLAPKGFLILGGGEPFKVAIDRFAGKYATQRARRSCEREIKKTLTFIQSVRGSLLEEHPFARKVLAGSELLSIEGVK